MKNNSQSEARTIFIYPIREQRDFEYPKLRDEADSATTKNQKCSLWISSSSVEAIGIMDRDYGLELWIGIMDWDYGLGLWIGIMD